MKRITVFVFLIYVLNGLLEITVFPYIFGGGVIAAVRYTCYLWFAIKAVHGFTKSGRVPIVTVSLAILAVFIIVSTGKMAAGVIVLILCAMQDIEFDDVIRRCLYGVTALFAAVLILSALKILPNWEFYRGDTVRYALGFHYPTDTHSVYLSIVLMFVYVFRERLKNLPLFLLFAGNLILYLFTDGRLGFILTTAVLIFGLLYRHLGNKVCRAPTWAYACLPLTLTAIALTCVMLYRYGTGLGIFLNDLLSDRLMYASRAIDSYPLTLFGGNIEWFGWGGYGHSELPADFEYNFVDISYIRILFDFGIAGSAVILFGYTALMTTLSKEQKYFTAAIVTMTLIWAFIEPTIAVPARNIFILLLAQGRFKKVAATQGV